MTNESIQQQVSSGDHTPPVLEMQSESKRLKTVVVSSPSTSTRLITQCFSPPPACTISADDIVMSSAYITPLNAKTSTRTPWTPPARALSCLTSCPLSNTSKKPSACRKLNFEAFYNM